MDITQTAIEKIEKVLTEQDMLYFRIGVRGGGCSGFQYTFDVAEEPEKSDTVLPLLTPGMAVIVDSASLPLIEDATIDYQESLQGSSLIIKNPAASRCCGCGKSFSV